MESMQKIDLDNPFQAPVYYEDIVESTMTAIREIEGAGHGTVLAAGFQSAGRGRIAGRTWLGGQDENVYFSMVLDGKMLPFPVISLSARTGFALAGFLNSEYGIPARVKWPNDVLVNGKKISGILLEVKKQEIVLGCGINCLQTEFAPLRTEATSVKLESGSEDTPMKLLGKFLPYLHEEFSGNVSLDSRSALVWNFGIEIAVKTGHPDSGQLISGKIAGLNEDGSLRLAVGDEITSVYSGEIVIN